MYLLHGIAEGSGEEGASFTRYKEDLAKIRSMGFNTVYLFDIYRDPEFGATYFPLWYPEEAPKHIEQQSFDAEMQHQIEEAFDGVFKEALQKNLNVILSICYNLPLKWLCSNLDAAKRKPDGSLHHTMYFHECFRSEKVRRYTRGRLEQLLGKYADEEHFTKALARIKIKGNDAILDKDGHPLFVVWIQLCPVRPIHPFHNNAP